MLELNSRELLLKRLDMLSSEIERLKRDVIHVLVTEAPAAKQKPSLFGSVRGADVTEAMIQETRDTLFRPALDV